MQFSPSPTPATDVHLPSSSWRQILRNYFRVDVLLIPANNYFSVLDLTQTRSSSDMTLIRHSALRDTPNSIVISH